MTEHEIHWEKTEPVEDMSYHLIVMSMQGL